LFLGVPNGQQRTAASLVRPTSSGGRFFDVNDGVVFELRQLFESLFADATGKPSLLRVNQHVNLQLGLSGRPVVAKRTLEQSGIDSVTLPQMQAALWPTVKEKRFLSSSLETILDGTSKWFQ